MPRLLIVPIVALMAALYVLPLVDPFPLLDPDEGLHAAITQEMIARRDYVMPRFLGQPFLDKPIVFFWAQALAMIAFGQNEAAARLPGLIFGALGAITTGWLAATILRNRGGWLAAFFYTTMLVPMALMQSPVHDIALVPFINVALLAFWRAARASDTARIANVLVWSALAGVALGVSILTKGLTGVAIVGLAHPTVLLVEKRLRPVVIAGGGLAFIVAAAIALPWYLAMERAQPGYLHYYFVERHFFGFATGTQRHAGRPFWYYVPVLLAGGLPWVVYVPFALRRWWTAPAPASADGSADARRLGFAWLLTGWIFLSIAGSKLFTYALPLFPAIALLAMAAWLHRLANAPSYTRPFDRAAAAHALISALLVPGALIVVSRRFSVSPGLWLWAASCGLAVGWWLTWRAWTQGMILLAARRGTLITAATAALLIAFVVPPVASRMTARGLARYLNAIGQFPPELWIVRQRLGSVVFYLDPELRQRVTTNTLRQVQPPQLLQFTAPPGTLVAVADEDARRVSRFVPVNDVPYDWPGRYRVYAAERLGIRTAR